jgi:hypothetical protein
MGKGAVMHIVVRSAPGYRFVRLEGGRSFKPTDDWEFWSDRSLKQDHSIVRERGRIVEEDLHSDEAERRVGVPDPAYAGLWAGSRPAFASGTAKLIGKGTIYGHRVYWLRFAYPDAPGASTRVAVDRDSYRPIAFWRFVNGGHFPLERVLLARTEPFAASDFRRLTPLRLPSKSSSSGSIPGPAELSKPWLTAGRSIGGLKLRSAVPATVKAARRTSHGVQLFYGSPRGSKSIQIDEEQTPADPTGLAIPAGYVRILPTQEPSYIPDAHTVWMGALEANGVYVSILTKLGRDALLAAARALKPV